MVFRPCKPKKKKTEDTANFEEETFKQPPDLKESSSTAEHSLDDPQPEAPEEDPQAKWNSSKEGTKQKGRYQVLNAPPSAREAAFGGPPRYDWIDVETAAAVKIQSKFRQVKVVQELESQGITTSAYRNKQRAREKKAAENDAPFFFGMCGVSSVFGFYDEDAGDREAKEMEARKRKEKEAAIAA